MRLAPVERVLGDDCVQGSVPGLGFDGVNALALMGQADQSRPMPMPTIAQEGEAAIVEAGPHADPVALSIESNQWHQDQVKALWWHDLAVSCSGFEDAEPVAG